MSWHARSRWRTGMVDAVAAAVLLALSVPAASAMGAGRHPQGPAPQELSLGKLARQVRAEHARREHLYPPRVYTNADLPAMGHISVFGQASKPPTAPTSQAATAAKIQQTQVEWQRQVAQAQRQLSLDQQALNVTQREWNLSQAQYYSNPNIALQQQYSRSDINQKAAQVKALQAKIQADQQHLQDLQDNPPLRP